MSQRTNGQISTAPIVQTLFCTERHIADTSAATDIHGTLATERAPASAREVALTHEVARAAVKVAKKRLHQRTSQHSSLWTVRRR
jgi:hypothetical protein